MARRKSQLLIGIFRHRELLPLSPEAGQGDVAQQEIPAGARDWTMTGRRQFAGSRPGGCRTMN
jgi:hypothetical protein